MPPRSSNLSNTLAGTSGNILEWYDFAVFGFLAPVMSPLFFPEADPIAGLIQTYGVFAAGYLMRPLGGVLFGFIGDRLGRKRALQWSIFLMAIPTVVVGLLPTHEQLGATAALLLILLRLVQGASVGGELVGSVAWLVETADPRRRGLLGSWSLFGAISGILLGSLVVTLLNAMLDASSMASWGWRVPFLGGAVIFFVGLWLRRSMTESPDFEQAAAAGTVQHNPLVHALRENGGVVVHLVAMLLLYAAGFYMLFVWMPTYLDEMVEPPVPHALAVNTLSMVVLLAVIPLAGWLSDRVGRRPILLGASLAMAVVVYPLFLWVDGGTLQAAITAQLVFAVLIGCVQGPFPALMVELFPAQSRFSAIGVSYNVALALFGGTAPLVGTWLIERTGDLASPALYLALLSVLSFLALLPLGRRSGAQPSTA